MSYGLGSSIGAYYYGNKKCEGSYLYTLIGAGMGTTISYWLLNNVLPSILKHYGDDVDDINDSDNGTAPLGIICLAAIIPPALGAIGFGLDSKGKYDANMALINYNNSKLHLSLPSLNISSSIYSNKRTMYKFYVFNSHY